MKLFLPTERVLPQRRLKMEPIKKEDLMMTKLTRRDTFRFGAALAALPFSTAIARADGHASAHTVVIKGHAFTPADIEIKAGDSITWINEDNARHSATDLNGAFDTGLLSRGQEATMMFVGAGKFEYRCTPHASMRGTITVS
ncbi:plastocyanin/azurin family copper-binding protein [Yoonia algicola]|uniref:Plastocyanin/azurin family copper-binding protein n=1 Tax=Yoonia algicola TaxID=3137368 RepID=A0AAN0M8B0_9RHOB